MASSLVVERKSKRMMVKCSSGVKVSVCRQRTNRPSAAVAMKVTRNLEVAQRRLTLCLLAA